MMYTVRFKDDGGWLEFSQPSSVLRARSAPEAYDVLEQAERALDRGAWIAGIVPYELTGTTLGIFGEPARPAAVAEQPYAITPLLSSLSSAAYAKAIERIRRAIYDGDVYQVNFTVPFDLEIDGDAFSLWQALARRTNARYQAYVEDGERRVLSWSPELFLAFDGTRVTTKPMKGTAPPDDVAPLLAAKNRAEHVMIVDLLRNDLRRFCDDVDVIDLCAIERYPTFATMTSTIEGTLRDGTRLSDVFRAAFPCGSITGAPKRAAIEAISRLESRERGAYCGSIGFLSPKRTGWWNVAIRTAQLEGTRGRFDAGGGIVSDSESGDEWNEILIKSAFLRSEARDFELWETFAGDASHDTLQRHLARVSEAAARIGIPLDTGALRAQAVAAMDVGRIVRLRVALDGTVRAHTEPLELPAQAVPVRLARARVRSDDPWLAVKSSHRPAQRAAWAEAQEHGCFDAILRNERDELTEGSRATIFVELDGTLYTPPLRCGLLPGILRARMLEEGRVRECVLLAGEIDRASALYVGNSARGLLRATLYSGAT